MSLETDQMPGLNQGQFQIDFQCVLTGRQIDFKLAFQTFGPGSDRGNTLGLWAIEKNRLLPMR